MPIVPGAFIWRKIVDMFFAQNHSAMTHLPLAAAVMVAACAIAALFTSRREIARAWAVLAIVAFVSALPAVATGVEAAEGRFSGDGKPYIQHGYIVSKTPASERVWRHQMLGGGGSAIAAVLATLGVSVLRGKSPNKYLVTLLALVLAVLWAIGAHTGGAELWGPDTFPAFKS